MRSRGISAKNASTSMLGVDVQKDDVAGKGERIKSEHGNCNYIFRFLVFFKNTHRISPDSCFFCGFSKVFPSNRPFAFAPWLFSFPKNPPSSELRWPSSTPREPSLRGALVNKSDLEGRSPLHIAALSGHTAAAPWPAGARESQWEMGRNLRELVLEIFTDALFRFEHVMLLCDYCFCDRMM